MALIFQVSLPILPSTLALGHTDGAMTCPKEAQGCSSAHIKSSQCPRPWSRNSGKQVVAVCSVPATLVGLVLKSRELHK